MAVQLGHTWCVSHGHLRFASFLGGRGRAALLNQDVRARRQAPPQAKLRHTVSLNAPIRQQRKKRESEHRPAGKRRIELTLRENVCFSDQNRKREDRARIVFGTGEKNNQLKGRSDESTCEGADRFGERRRGGHGERQQDRTYMET